MMKFVFNIYYKYLSYWNLTFNQMQVSIHLLYQSVYGFHHIYFDTHLYQLLDYYMTQ